ncbi:MAG: Uma2 family endonuclease [Myxococcales bacterium]|nr:Uma2 family endonuclease [Myxococcales bacterium]
MSMPLSAPDLVSEEEFLSLPETTQRVELLDGEVIVARSPTWGHQNLVGRFYRALAAWADEHPPAAVALAPLDVRFGPGRILQPDVLLVLQGIPMNASMPLDVMPDLVIEVLSRRRSYDRITKRVVYAEAGVAEYWVVDGTRKLVEVHTEDGTTLVRGSLESARLPGFSLDVAALFR